MEKNKVIELVSDVTASISELKKEYNDNAYENIEKIIKEFFQNRLELNKIKLNLNHQKYDEVEKSLLSKILDNFSYTTGGYLQLRFF